MENTLYTSSILSHEVTKKTMPISSVNKYGVESAKEEGVSRK